MKNWSRVPDGRLTPGRTGRLIVGRNVTLSLTLTFSKLYRFKKIGVDSVGVATAEVSGGKRLTQAVLTGPGIFFKVSKEEFCFITPF
jgi:hypothetical protein